MTQQDQNTMTESKALSDVICKNKEQYKKDVADLTAMTLEFIRTTKLDISVLCKHLHTLEAFSRGKRHHYALFARLYRQDNTIRLSLLTIMANQHIKVGDILELHKRIYKVNPTYTALDFHKFFEGITEEDFVNATRDKAYFKKKCEAQAKTIATQAKRIKELEQEIERRM